MHFKIFRLGLQPPLKGALWACGHISDPALHPGDISRPMTMPLIMPSLKGS